MATKADAFSVWGQPPEALTKDLTQAQIRLLKKYAGSIGEATYRMAFDNGVQHAFGIVSDVTEKEWEKQRRKVI